MYYTLSDVLTEKSVTSNLKAKNKDDVIKELIELLEESGKVTDREEVLKAINKRESLASTSIENGIAMPHTKCDGVEEVCMAIGISKEGIAFGQNGLTNIFVLAVSPNDNTSSYLRTLVNLINKLQSANTRNEIMSIDDERNLYDYVCKLDTKMVSV
ncbi:MAG: PTS sugar transporter subunit IIA [Treponema sp.]|nr:PTS sugar transporter subunit IIA [Treponema sp.]